MKIPTKTIRLAELDEEWGDLFLKMSRSVKIKWAKQFQHMAAQQDDPKMQEIATVELFSLVQEWNLTDDNDQVLPLVKDVPDLPECTKDGHAEGCAKVAITEDLPLEVFTFLAGQIAGGGNTPEKTKDF